MSTAPIVSTVWSFCTTLRDDGVGYGDYLEQLTYLIFLPDDGMTHSWAMRKVRYQIASPDAPALRWASLK